MRDECHWYGTTFAADGELPQCDPTMNTIDGVCQELGLEKEDVHVAKVGSVAKRQMRICMDFRVVVKE